MVKTTDTQGKTRLLRRSVQHLIPIEVRNEDNLIEDMSMDSNSNGVTTADPENDLSQSRNRSCPCCTAAITEEQQCRINKL